MSQLQDRIAQFRKMANDDPDNELGHYRLGQLLMEARQFPEAIQSFRRTLELSPRFSKVYQLLAQCLLDDNRRDEAVEVLKQGFVVADEQGDNMPPRCHVADADRVGRAGAGVEEKSGAPAGRRRWLSLPASRLLCPRPRAATGETTLQRRVGPAHSGRGLYRLLVGLGPQLQYQGYQ